MQEKKESNPYQILITYLHARHQTWETKGLSFPEFLTRYITSRPFENYGVNHVSTLELDEKTKELYLNKLKTDVSELVRYMEKKNIKLPLHDSKKGGAAVEMVVSELRRITKPMVSLLENQDDLASDNVHKDHIIQSLAKAYIFVLSSELYNIGNNITQKADSPKKKIKESYVKKMQLNSKFINMVSEVMFANNTYEDFCKRFVIDAAKSNFNISFFQLDTIASAKMLTEGINERNIEQFLLALKNQRDQAMGKEKLILKTLCMIPAKTQMPEETRKSFISKVIAGGEALGFTEKYIERQIDKADKKQAKNNKTIKTEDNRKGEKELVKKNDDTIKRKRASLTLHKTDILPAKTTSMKVDKTIQTRPRKIERTQSLTNVKNIPEKKSTGLASSGAFFGAGKRDLIDKSSSDEDQNRNDQKPGNNT